MISSGRKGRHSTFNRFRDYAPSCLRCHNRHGRLGAAASPPVTTYGAVRTLLYQHEIWMAKGELSMVSQHSRRSVLIGLAAAALPACPKKAREVGSPADELEAYRTRYKHPELILAGTGTPGTFDELAVDIPFVFKHEDRFFMTYVGFDGQGYQTGLARSGDLVNWTRVGLIAGRDESDPYTRHNIALTSILRDSGLRAPGLLKRVDGRYLGVWNAYPEPGYEEGAAVIGLAWSDDLMNWERTAPILFPGDGAVWERGGLYKPYIFEEDGLYYIYYNAKTEDVPWHEQIGVATSRDLVTWNRYDGNPLLRNGPPGAADDRFAADPVVLRHDGRWVMFYYGYSTDRAARDLLALGDDAFHFTKVSEPMIDVGPPGSVDETYAHKPGIIHHHGVLYHYYCAVSGKWPHETRGIAVARSRPW